MPAYNRETLIKKLETVAPALAVSDLAIPVMTHIAFLGRRIMAYNDKIGISTVLNTAFTGAVPGKALLDLLPTSEADEITVALEDGQAQFAADDLTIDLPVHPLDQFTRCFTMPKMPEGQEFSQQDADRLFPAITDCLRAVGGKAVQVAEQQGITVIPGSEKLSLYSTDQARICFAQVTGLTDRFKRPLILSSEFCRQMLRLGHGAQQMSLHVFDEAADESAENPQRKRYVLFRADKTTLYAPLIDPSGQVDFVSAVKRHMPSEVRRNLIAVPEGLGRTLSRCKLLGDDIVTIVTVDNGTAEFTMTPSYGGKIVSRLAIDGHPDTTVKFSGGLLHDGYEGCKSLRFTESCGIMKNEGNSYYLVAPLSR